MADPKNEPGKTPSTDKQAGADNGAGSKISAGTSVGNPGQSPMPQSHDPTKQAQSATLASHTSKPLGGQGGQGSGDRAKSPNQSSQQQPGSMADKAQQTAAQAGEKVRETADQVRQKAGEVYEGASEWAQDTYESVSGWASDTYDQHSDRVGNMRDRSAKTLGNVRGGVQQYVSENPMVVGLVGLAAGLLLGALIPRTRRENEVFGEWSDEVRNQGLRYARDATHKGREFVEEAFSGEDPRFSKHESEFRPDRPGADHH